jgi:hypothetical protein
LRRKTSRRAPGVAGKKAWTREEERKVKDNNPRTGSIGNQNKKEKAHLCVARSTF